MMKQSFLLALVVILSGCSVVNKTLPPDLEIAQALEQTDTFNELKNLPSPAGSVAVSVYSFRDQTGQYKPQANVSSFSTAVTQGANSILVQALHESDWFTPVEREGLQNILTERKIVRASLKDKEDETTQLPPLTTAKIILEGGIISYDSNVKTGGLGMEYFGIGASELYREDVISIYLRAVDVRTGQILLSVATTKKVLSQEIRAGFFRYVSYKRLAEAEAGYSENEPMHICVKQAIEKALSTLVIKGIDKGIWTTQEQNKRALEQAKAKQAAAIKQQQALKAQQMAAVSGQAVAQLSFAVQFRTGAAQVESVYADQLNGIIELLNREQRLNVQLYGYADQRGHSEDNSALSLNRSKNIAQYLLQNGIAVERIAIAGLGEDQALFQPDDPEGLFFDRRVIIKVNDQLQKKSL